MVDHSIHFIITGANGLVGSSLLKELISAYPQNTIKAFVRRLPAKPLAGVDYVMGDLTQSIPADLFSQNSFLFHFAHQHKARDLETLRKTNVHGLKNILTAGQNRIKKIFLGSSMSVYGQGPFLNVSEEAQTAPQTNLAHTRREAEELVVNFATNAQIPYHIFRPRFLFDPRETETLPKIYQQFQKGVLLGNGEQRYSYILVEDYVRLILLGLNLEKSMVLNVAYPQSISLKEIYSLFGNFHHRRSIPVKLFIAVTKLVGPKSLATKLQLIGQNQTMDTEKLISLYPEFKAIDSIGKLKPLAQSLSRGHP